MNPVQQRGWWGAVYGNDRDSMAWAVFWKALPHCRLAHRAFLTGGIHHRNKWLNKTPWNKVAWRKSYIWCALFIYYNSFVMHCYSCTSNIGVCILCPPHYNCTVAAKQKLMHTCPSGRKDLFLPEVTHFLSWLKSFCDRSFCIPELRV